MGVDRPALPAWTERESREEQAVSRALRAQTEPGSSLTGLIPSSVRQTRAVDGDRLLTGTGLLGAIQYSELCTQASPRLHRQPPDAKAYARTTASGHSRSDGLSVCSSGTRQEGCRNGGWLCYFRGRSPPFSSLQG
jgi:hypothetical protein